MPSFKPLGQLCMRDEDFTLNQIHQFFIAHVAPSSQIVGSLLKNLACEASTKKFLSIVPDPVVESDGQ
jgi:hypothetical protein